jgi:hypothetical protein
MSSYYKMHLDETLRKPIYDGQVQNLDFLNYVSTTAQTGWNVGDVVVLPDGREFRHALSDGVGVIEPDQGCHFTDTGYISYTAFAVAATAGTREITIPAATHAALTKDALAGGYVIIFNGSADDDCTYGIVGNDAADANAAFDVKLQRGVNPAVTTSSAAEVYINPWSAISQASSSVLPYCGCAVRKVSAAANYFWVQTKGIKFISPQTGVGNDNGGIAVMWRHDGSVQKGETALAVTVATNDTNQQAGYVISGSAAGNGPLINMTGY